MVCLRWAKHVFGTITSTLHDCVSPRQHCVAIDHAYGQDQARCANEENQVYMKMPSLAAKNDFRENTGAARDKAAMLPTTNQYISDIVDSIVITASHPHIGVDVLQWAINFRAMGPGWSGVLNCKCFRV